MSISYLEEIVETKYFVHPKNTDWMKTLVQKWAKDNPNEIHRAEFKSNAYKAHHDFNSF